jgi:ATP-dependent exoDNAse (exonuclease V) beta subunit
MQPQLLVYKSSAGSGKTTQIVKEYLHLVIPATEKYRQILAITFTNKAAEEMKGRIVAVLEQLSRQGCRGPGMDIFAEGLLQKGLREETIQANAAIVLKDILHDYSNFAVSTIDSLMHRIIRSFAFDLNLSQRFEVLLDQEELIEKSVDLLLDELTPGSNLTRFLVDFVKSSTDESRSWHIDRSLYAFGKVLQTDEAIDYMPRLKAIDLENFIAAEKAIRKFNAIFEGYMDTLAEKAFTLIDDIPAEAFSHGKSGAYGFFAKIRRKQYRQSDGGQIFQANTHSAKFFHEGKFSSSKATAGQQAHISSIAQELIGIYQKITTYAEKEAARYFFYRMLLRNLHGMAVLKEIEVRLQQLKAEKDCIHISEFNRRISQEIQANASVPFIYERIGEKYYHCFVDEFQDTSVLQWHNLLPLLVNGLSNNAMNMLVGDAKQSIYRWRGGEVEQFSKLPQLFDKQKLPDGDLLERTLTTHYHEKALQTNYRSAEAIVDFNNSLFGYIKENSNPRVQAIYEAHQQKVIRKHYGKVSVRFVEGKGEELAAGHLGRLLEAVTEALNDGYTRDNIAILCRTKDKGMQVAGYLAENGHQVVSSDSLLLSGSPKLHFIAALLKLLNNPADSLAQLETAFFIYQRQQQSPRNLHDHLRQFITNSLTEKSSKSSEAFRDLTGLLNLDHINWEEFSLYDLVEHLVRLFGLHEPSDPFIVFFLEEVYRKTLENETGLTDFLEWWEANKAKRSIVAPEKMDALKVYTIHKAKGLEFPVVIAPFISSNAVKPTADNLWVEVDEEYEEAAALPVAHIPATKALHDTKYAAQFTAEEEKSLLDEVNVLYVAFTRPSERLYVVSDMPPKRKGNTSMAALVAGYIENAGNKISPEEAVVFEKGEKSSDAATSHDPAGSPAGSLVSASWRNKIVIASQVNTIPRRREQSAAKYWGSVLHDALARVICHEDITKATKQMHYEGTIQEDEVPAIENILKKITTHPQLSPLFSKNRLIRTEHPLMLLDGNVLRPDRLSFEENKVVVLEYKTGTKQEGHYQQVEAYAEALNSTGYEVTGKYLAYIKEDVTVEVL